MPVKFKWYGDELKKKIADEINKTGQSTANLILKEAKRNINNVDGDLEKSGRVIKFQKDDVIGWYIKFGNSKVFYSLFVEVGTPGTETRTGKDREPVKAFPYLRPPFKKHKRKITKLKKVL